MGLSGREGVKEFGGIENIGIIIRTYKMKKSIFNKWGNSIVLCVVLRALSLFVLENCDMRHRSKD